MGLAEFPREGTCLRCRQTLPHDVTFCVSCGFDNGEMQRVGKAACFDLQIQERLAWLRLKQQIICSFLWSLIRR